MYKNLLPIGSVVLLKGGNKRVMICGRVQNRAGTNEIYDYSACFFPEGIVNPGNMFFFNRDAIETVFFSSACRTRKSWTSAPRFWTNWAIWKYGTARLLQKNRSKR